MKELSIEQKAQRYDEALKCAKSALGCLADDYICNHLTKDDIRGMYANFFPELKESEDEMIRKDMMETIKKESKDFPSSVIAEKSRTWLAWLEKQGEQNLANSVKTCKDEQNLNACLGYIPDEFLRRWLMDVVHIKYDKPAWSEEDKEMLDEIIDFFENGIVKLKHDLSLYASWLKSLKGRVRPKQEWSEADEKMRNFIIGVFKDSQRHGVSEAIMPEQFNKIFAWLESLRPQNTWKPSEEQLKSLKKIIDVGYYTSYPNVLETLYEQLKNLI